MIHVLGWFSRRIRFGHNDSSARYGITRIRSAFVAAVVVTLGTNVGILAQPSLWIGPTIAYEHGVPLGIERDPGIINRYNYNGQGTSRNSTLSFGATIFDPAYFGERLGVKGLLALEIADGIFTSNYFPVDTAIPAFGQQQFTVTSDIGQIRIEPALHYRIGSRLGVEFGVYGTYRMFSTITQTLRNTNLPDSERVVATGELISSSAFHYGATFRAGTSVPLSNSADLWIQPFIRTDLNALTSGIGTRSFSGGLELSLLIRSSSRVIRPDTQPIIRTDNRIPIPKPRLSATIRIVSGDSGTTSRTVIAPQNSYHKITGPFIPVIVFTEHSATPVLAYNSLTPEDASTFTIASLAQRDIREIQHNVLNIVGLRMKSNPDSRITFTGYSPSKTASDLFTARVDYLKGYLTGVWGISSERMTVSTVTDSRSRIGEDRVIITGTQGLLSPVVVEWQEENYSMPPLRIRKHIQAESRVIAAITTLRQGDSTLGRYYGEGETFSHGMDLSLDMKDGAAPDPLIADFLVRDSAGSEFSISDTMHFTVGNLPQASPRTQNLSFLFYSDSCKLVASSYGNVQHASIEQALSGATSVTIQALGGLSQEQLNERANEVLAMITRKRLSLREFNILRSSENNPGTADWSPTGYRITIR